MGPLNLHPPVYSSSLSPQTPLRLDLRGTHQSTPAHRPRPLPGTPHGGGTPLLSPVDIATPRHSFDMRALLGQRPPAPPGTSSVLAQHGTPLNPPIPLQQQQQPAGVIDGGGSRGVWLDGVYYNLVPGVGVDGGGLRAQPQQHATLQHQQQYVPNPQQYVVPPQPPQLPPQQQFAHGHPYQPQFHMPQVQVPQVQYVQLPVRRDRQLPSTDKNEMLKGSSSYAGWALWVKNLIMAQGLYDHISSPTEPGLRPTQWPTYQPAFGATNYEAWWSDDDVARHIITSRLDPTILRSLPSMDPTTNGPVPSRDLWDLLYKQFGAGMISTTLQKWNSVVARRISVDRVSELPKYVSDFREAYNCMVVAGQPVTYATVLATIASALPEVGGLGGLARDFRNAADSAQAASFHPTLVFEQLDREVQNYLAKHPTSSFSRSRRPGSSNKSASKIICENCSKEGHDKSRCWAPGVDRKGRGTRSWLGCVVDVVPLRLGCGVAAVASASASTPTPVVPTAPAVNGGGDGGAGGVGDHMPLVASVVTIPEFKSFDLYDAVLVSSNRLFPDGFDNLLDSGCTLHLFSNPDVFWDFEAGSTESMTTANCGDLSTEGRGLVKLRVTLEDGSSIELKLHDCRYAPKAPCNLLSVGDLQRKGVGINYSSDGNTYINLRNEYTLKALRLGKLSFLEAEIVYPPGTGNVAAASIRDRVVDPWTWHLRFGHLGMADTRRMLIGSYALGIKYAGEMKDEVCPPCVVAKANRRFVGPLGGHAEGPCGIFHIDLSGPHSIRTKTGAYSGLFAYFAIMLDDWSNYGYTVLLKDRGSAGIRDAFINWRRMMERETGAKVKMVKMDGAKELTKGVFGEYLKQEGIHIDDIIPYHHWQNGKAERYIQTIDNTARAMLAGSLLPPSYWGDSVLTAQFLRNRLPTSTLPHDITPYERIFNKKPDLSYLRVFGSLGHAWIPPEKRYKGDHRRVPVILVGVVSRRIQHPLAKLRESQWGDDTDSEPTVAELRAERLASLRSGTRQGALPPPVSMFMVLPDGVDTMASYEVACSLVNTPTPDGNPRPSTTYDDEGHALECVFIATREDPTVYNRVRKDDLSRPPKTWKEALAREDGWRWVDAMREEVRGLFLMEVLEKVERLPDGRRAIPLKWVFAFKYDEFGKVIGYKARLVVQGCRQRPEDYGTTSSPVARMACIKALLAWACRMNWSVFSFDIKTAFLHATLHELVFVGQIPGFPELAGAVYRLKRALYGLKQSAYEFYIFLKESLSKIGVFHCDVDRAVFVGIWNTPPDPSIPMPPDNKPLILMVPVHVDDGLAVSNSDELYAWFIKRLSELMQVKDLGHATLYLGIRIVRDRAGRRMWLSQRAYVEDLLAEWKLSACTGHRVPLPRSLDDPINMSDNVYKNYTDDQVRELYLRLVGAILYLALCTRPDLAYAAMALAQHNAAPTRSHLAAAKGVLRYLASTLDFALQYPAPHVPNPDRSSILASDGIRVETCGFSDADWASDVADRRSVSGYAVYFMGCLVSWSATKQRVVALSSNEAELYALSHLTREILWFRMFLKSIRLPCPRPFPIFADNQSTIAMVHAENINGRSKHIDVRHHFIRDHIKEGSISAKWLSTKDNTADIFTKSLPKDLFYLHRSNLGLVPLPVTEAVPT
ncbi:hypothetical protein NMY22_g14435 [Coprinellus aureogranulatus]|nr:hypothetical protein NMY22_g14435 [Coprinellus aureogranulatus]